jgi:hypothetical protein
MKDTRWLLGVSVTLIVVGLIWFISGLPQATPAVEWLWATGGYMRIQFAAGLALLSTFVNNLWRNANALPISLKIAFIGLILLSIFALQQYARQVGKSLFDILPAPISRPLRWLASVWDGIIFQLRNRLPATAFLILTLLMIVYFALAIVGTATGTFSAFGFGPPTATATAVLPTATTTPTPVPQMPRELWDGKYAEENRLGTPPVEIAIRQALAARDSALTNFRRWLKGEINWSSAELRLKMNDADAARTFSRTRARTPKRSGRRACARCGRSSTSRRSTCAACST